MKEKIIEYRKKHNQMIKTAKKLAKKDHCICCKKKLNGFCKSHFVPEFILRNIEVNGNVLYCLQILGSDFAKNKMGIGEAGTFYLICNECDSYLFHDYEDEKHILDFEIGNNRFMASIALKNYMSQLYKRNYEIFYQDEFSNFAPKLKTFNDETKKIYEMDQEDYLYGFNRAYHILEKNLKSGYVCIFHKLLDYKVPIAFQGMASLQQDLNGNIINEIYCYDKSKKLQDIHICIFPLSFGKTFVLMFVHKDDTKYKKFIRQFNRLELNEKLKVINYIVFAYCEDYFFSEKIDRSFITDDFLNICGNQPSNVNSIINELLGKSEYEFKDMDKISCILDSKYAVE